MFDPSIFATMKYAELRKHAKNVGIKANLKQEKLIAELTQYYEKKSSDCKVEKSKPRTPIPKINTPVQVLKNTPGKKTPVPPARKTSVQKTPVLNEKMPLGNTTATPKTPVQDPAASNKGASRWVKKVFTPVSKPCTPANKVATPGHKVATPIRSVNKTATPISKTATPAKNQGSGKRKQTDMPSTPQPSKKRRSTFETVPTPDLNTPEVEPNKERRRSGRIAVSTSPGVTEMLGSMKADMNAEEMKESLLSVIEKKVHEKAKVAPTAGSSIPRFAAFLKKREESKPVTPGNKNWNKIHRKNFDKFDSIDVYLDKKRKRAEEITSSVKKARHILEEVHSVVDRLKSHKTPQENENKFKKPRVSGANKTTPFKPTVFNTNKLNFNFGAKVSPKTLPRKSPKSMLSVSTKTPSNTSTSVAPVRKSTGSVLPRKSTATPFKFTAVQKANMNISTASTKKTVFDLKASLARPLTWKPHKGKLMPMDSKTTNKEPSAVKVKKGRDEVKAKLTQRRTNKKQNAQMARRGINV